MIRQWFGELFDGFSDFSKRMVRFSAYCVLAIVMVIVFDQVPSILLLVGINSPTAPAIVRAIQTVWIISILPAFFRHFKVIALDLPKLNLPRSESEVETEAELNQYTGEEE